MKECNASLDGQTNANRVNCSPRTKGENDSVLTLQEDSHPLRRLGKIGMEPARSSATPYRLQSAQSFGTPGSHGGRSSPPTPSPRVSVLLLADSHTYPRSPPLDSRVEHIFTVPSFLLLLLCAIDYLLSYQRHPPQV
jgi:hypothetical protein